MSYSDQIDRLVRHFKSGEKNPSDFTIGIEIEHFLLDKFTMEAILYSGERGVEKILEDLTRAGWQPVYEQQHILMLIKNGSSITLEPGAQLELSTAPRKRLRQIVDDYFSFLHDVTPVLNSRDINLTAIGYQPVSSISNIPFLPKKRYEHMQSYLKTKGKLAHNMMKGTASTQVSIDYSNEQDYIKKNKVVNFLAPIVYCMFDNAPYYEGILHEKRSARSIIWDNCDPDRCGAPSGVFTDRFGYEAYAEYILNTPSILFKKDNVLVATDNKKIKEIFDPESFSSEELEYLLTMVFPDSRTKTYIEIRMGDSMPYPFSISYAAFWKGLMYNAKNLNTLFMQAIEFDKRTLDKIKKDIRANGALANFGNKTVFDAFKCLLAMAMDGLDDCEKKYLHPIIALSESGLTLKDLTLNNETQKVSKAIEWCILNEFAYDGSCSHIACR